ncbi:hypothetical protein [Lachnospira multipara]|uniref:hypothetical protein n=1 Tax=Lachnospira multipara TaxID=28051 RepID=UPI00041D5640|nr:hypothetical protein [Lachnospira multipara]
MINEIMNSHKIYEANLLEKLKEYQRISRCHNSWLNGKLKGLKSLGLKNLMKKNDILAEIKSELRYACMLECALAGQEE